jgi:hypothetical protein
MKKILITIMACSFVAGFKAQILAENIKIGCGNNFFWEFDYSNAMIVRGKYASGCGDQFVWTPIGIGVSITEDAYLNDNLFTGICQDIDTVGNIIGEYRFDNGKLSTLKEYNSDGLLIMDLKFSEGIPNGENTAYYSDGKTHVKQKFINGVLNGESIFYYPSGEIQTKQQYLNGNLIGFFIESIGFDDYDSPTGGNFCVEEGYYKDGERLVISKVCDY